MHRTFVNAFPRTAVACLSLFVAAALLLHVCSAVEPEKPAAGAEEFAIRAAIESYVAAYNRGDAKAVAAFWSESGEWISPSGQRFQGRLAIEKEMQNLFNESKGVRIEVINPSIRMASSQVAIEEGTVRVIRPSEPPSVSTYLAVDVKEGGQWKLNTVCKTEVPETPAASSQLQELAWLVGDWVDESLEADDAATVTWTKNKTFLSYAFKASAAGMDDLEGTQVIGWDPAAGTIRSWMFDSDGGFGEGIWSKKGNPGAWWPGKWAIAATAWATWGWGTAGSYCGCSGEGAYYDYGGNVTYEDDTVYYGDQPVASAGQYYTMSSLSSLQIPGRRPKTKSGCPWECTR